MSVKDALPCPFCGSDDLEIEPGGRIGCDDCGAMGPFPHDGIEEMCNELWNLRGRPPTPRRKEAEHGASREGGER